jgi:nucleoredoxin
VLYVLQKINRCEDKEKKPERNNRIEYHLILYRFTSINMLRKLLGRRVVDNRGNKHKVRHLAEDNGIILLYFGAKFCPPCRELHQALDSKYRQWIERGYNINVVFISSDSHEHEFNEYFGKQAWLAVPYKYSKRRQRLQRCFGASSGIPRLIAIRASDGAVIDSNARQTFNELGRDAFQHWNSI